MLKSIFKFFEALGRARAASVLAQAGHYELARQLMLKH